MLYPLISEAYDVSNDILKNDILNPIKFTI